MEYPFADVQSVFLVKSIERSTCCKCFINIFVVIIIPVFFLSYPFTNHHHSTDGYYCLIFFNQCVSGTVAPRFCGLGFTHLVQGLFTVDTCGSMYQTLRVSSLPQERCPGPESLWMTVTLVINHWIRISNVNATVAWITCHICSLDSAAPWLPRDLLERPVWGIIGPSKDQLVALP